MPEPPDESGEGAGPVVIGLSEPERKVLKALQAAAEGPPLVEAAVASSSGLPEDAARGSLQRLRSKHLAVSEEEHIEERSLTQRGRSARSVGLPERRLLDRLKAAGAPVDPSDPSLGLVNDEERKAAIGILRRRGLIVPGVPLTLSETAKAIGAFPEETAMEVLSGSGGALDEAVFKELTRRGLAGAEHRTVRRWAASPEGRRSSLTADEGAFGALTPALLASGGWKDRPFRPYDVRADVPRRWGALSHPYRHWLDEFEEILIGLGFAASDGPLLESEFWNADVLFMPQEHPARSIHDVLSVRGVTAQPPPAELLERVAAAHEGRPLPGEAQAISPGWRAPYDRALSVRTVLRSQTTAVSARFLAGRPKPPFRIYSIGRNFRKDAVDATHHVEFHQCEGILGDRSVSLRELIGTFQALSEAIGIRELKLKPSYFPFTEPSIEGYVRHPRLGWIEVFPGGLLRPEVLRPLGIDVPVAAWGIGIMRLAMVALGVSDVRELYEDDLDRRRGGRV